MRRQGSLDRLKGWARAVKRDIVALWLAARDERVPWHAKVVAAAVAAYALSPIDLVPDFIPVLGYVDDLLLVPIGILVAVRLVPAEVLAELREKALGTRVSPSRAGLVAIVLAWLGALVLAYRLVTS